MTSPRPTFPVPAVPLGTPEQLRERIRRKSQLKGRQADEAVLAEVRALVGSRPAGGHRRDLLIEHLHLLSDAHRCLHERHPADLQLDILPAIHGGEDVKGLSPMPLPCLMQARAPLTHEVQAVNELGERQRVSIPAERALTVYVDKRELVTLMTLGAHPELLVLGYLRNQRLVRDVAAIESITVDWDVGAAAVKTRSSIEDIEAKTARRVVTSGCGQGSVFGGLMDEVDRIALPPGAFITQGQLYSLVNTVRLKDTTYKSAGSVHACALFSSAGDEPHMLLFVEDVGRHNAIDTIAGWMG